MIVTPRIFSSANNSKWVRRRVYWTNSRSPSRAGAPQHPRGFQSSRRNPYFSYKVPVELESAAAAAGGATVGGGRSVWQIAFHWYGEKLNTHPLLTKSVTGAVIALAGDVLCQFGTWEAPAHATAAEDESFWKSGWNVRRSFHFFVLGLTFVAPTSHYFYDHMAIHPWTRGQSFGQISKRVALDQFVWSPVFFVIWLSGFWGMERNGNITGAELTRDLTLAMPDIMVANWMLWIPCQYANFYAVPVKYQVLFSNIVELVWTAYLSFAAEVGSPLDDDQMQNEEEKK